VTSASTGTCNYTVESGDTSSDLTVSSISGTINNASNIAITNFTPASNLDTNKAIVIDTHNDFLSTGIEKNKSFDMQLKGVTHSDLNRMKTGGIDIQVFSIFCDEKYGKGRAYAFANREIQKSVGDTNPLSTLEMY
jgi:hypothetical protein